VHPTPLAIRAVEAFNKSVLIRLARLDVPELDLLPLTLFGESDRGKLAPVVSIRFNLAFSDSRSFIRLSSEAATPPCFARQLKYVGRLIPCLRIRSLIGTPDSPSFKISAI